MILLKVFWYTISLHHYALRSWTKGLIHSGYLTAKFFHFAYYVITNSTLWRFTKFVDIFNFLYCRIMNQWKLKIKQFSNSVTEINDRMYFSCSVWLRIGQRFVSMGTCCERDHKQSGQSLVDNSTSCCVNIIANAWVHSGSYART